MDDFGWDHARSRAVLFGTATYAQLPSVPAVRNSLARMEALLTDDLCGWPQERVSVFADERYPGDLPDQLVRLFQPVRDIALFYFVGHGQVDPSDELCLGLVESSTEAARRKTTSLRFDAVRYALSQSRAMAKIVILDCCYAGLAVPGTLAASDVVGLTRGTGAYTLAAAGEFGRAWFETEDADLPQTCFTRYFADVIERGMPGEAELLRLEPIFQEAAETLARAGKPVPTSRATGYAPRLVFARNAAALAATPAATPAILDTGNGGTPDNEILAYLRTNAIPVDASAHADPRLEDVPVATNETSEPADVGPDVRRLPATDTPGSVVHRHELRRNMGRLSLTATSLSSIAGSVLLWTSVSAAAYAGPAALLAWIIGGGATLVLAFSHAELAAMFPVAGGTVRFPRLAFGDLPGAMFGWVSWLQAVMIAPVEVVIAEALARPWWPALGSDPGDGQISGTGYVVAVALMAAFTAINLLGIRPFACVSTLLNMAKLAVAVAYITILMGSVRLHMHNFDDGGFMPYGFSGVLNAVAGSGVIYAYFGYEQADQFSGEARAPQRDIPFAVIGSVVIGIVIYLAQEIGFIGNLPGSQLAHGWAHIDTNGTITPDMAGILGLSWLLVVLRGFGMASPLSTGLLYAGSTARISHGLARNRYAPAIFGRTNRCGVPWAGLALAFALSLVAFLPSPALRGLVNDCLGTGGLMYAGVPLALSSIRRQFPRAYRPFRMPLASVLAPAGFVAANLFIYWTGWATLWKLGLFIVVGYFLIALNWVFQRDHRPTMPAWRSMVWLPAYLLGMGVITWQGSYGGGVGDLRPGWDILIVTTFSLVIHYWAVRNRLTEAEASRILGIL